MNDFKGSARTVGHGWLRDLLILTVVLGLPFLQFLGGLPLIDPDEGRYAEIPREMLERGDFITPTLNYVKYFEKPPLLYWLNAASIKLAGQNEFAARLPSALCGLLTVLACYLIARKIYDRRTALLAAALLGTSAGFVLQSRIILTDMLLTFCLTSALGAFIVAARNVERRGSGLAWYLFYLFCALAVLTKGLIGIVFPAGIIFLYLLLGKRWHLFARMRLASGILLFLAIAAPWFVAVSLHNPEFPRFFFIHEHFERFTSTVHGRYQPFWFFVPVLAATMLPWAFFVPGSLARAWQERHQNSGVGLYLMIWVLVIFLFFSKSSSKLIPYILPIFPPLAMLIAHRMMGLLEGERNSIRPACIVLGCLLSLLGMAALAYSSLAQVAAAVTQFMPPLAGPLNQFIRHAPHVAASTCVVVGLLFLLQGLVCLAYRGRNPWRVLLVLCLGGFLLELLAPRLIMPDIARAESPRELAFAAKAIATPESRMVTFGPMQGISWYTGQRVLVTGKIDELEFGSRQGDQSAWFPNTGAFLALWSGERQLLVFIKKGELEKVLPDLNPTPRLIKESGRFLLVSNR